MIGKFAKEFREFAIKGNALDMAVGIVIGAAFGKIVASLVDNLVMPLIAAIGNVDVANLWALDIRGSTIKLGAFTQSIVDFLIIAFAIFLALKVINSLQRDKPKIEEPKATPEDILLLREIRDALKRPGAP